MPDWDRFIQDVCSPVVAERDADAIKKSILDLFGVTVAARREEIAIPLDRFAATSKGVCTVIGLGRSATPETAALCNGTLGHALDFDDSNPWVNGHATTVIVPAVLALAELKGAGGADVVRAYAAGLTAAGRLGAIAAVPLYAAGWHTTSVLGGIGAAMAGATLLGLDPERTAAAFGTACSGAAGLRGNFGTMTKPFHAGNAARTGLTAALLAEAGFTSRGTAITTDNAGFFQTLLPNEELDLGQGWPEISAADCLMLKQYPCCFSTHWALDVVLEWRRTLGLRPDDVERMLVDLYPVRVTNLRYPEPQTGLQGKFSMQHTAAVALRNGMVTLRDFTPEVIGDPEIAAFRRKLTLAPRPELPAERRQVTRVTAVLKDGRELQVERDRVHGVPPDSLNWDEVTAKFRACAEYAGLTPDRGEKVVELVRNLEQVGDIRDVTDLLAR